MRKIFIDSVGNIKAFDSTSDVSLIEKHADLTAYYLPKYDFTINAFKDVATTKQKKKILISRMSALYDKKLEVCKGIYDDFRNDLMSDIQLQSFTENDAFLLEGKLKEVFNCLFRGDLKTANFEINKLADSSSYFISLKSVLNDLSKTY